MEVGVGIDVGLSAQRRSAGVVVLDCGSSQLAPGSPLYVGTTHGAIDFVLGELRRLEPSSATFVIDGPFAPAVAPGKVRRVERFFMTGPFAAVPAGQAKRLRLMPAPTRWDGSPFLTATRLVVNVLVGAGHREMELARTTLTGNIVEIFPTLFLAALLPPHAYEGKRGAHTDDLWLRVARENVPALAPYRDLVGRVEASPPAERHDLRAAAISAIAADWCAAAPPGSATMATTLIGHPVEQGFLLPPRAVFDPEFLALLELHWSASGGSPLVWL